MSEPLTPDPAQTESVRSAMPFAGVLDVDMLITTKEEVRGRIVWDESRCTSGGVLHGGVVMGLADTLGGLCAFLNLPDAATGTTTIESKTNFLRGVREGAVTASTRPLHIGRTMIVLETEIAREDGALVAKVTQTQAIHYPRD